jgi:hypothetical protein
MEVDFSQIIRDLDGVSLKNDDKSDAKLKNVCEKALLSEAPGIKVTDEDKLKRYSLALKIHDAVDKLDLTTDDISFIKKSISAVFPTLIVGRSFEMLEGKHL